MDWIIGISMQKKLLSKVFKGVICHRLLLLILLGAVLFRFLGIMHGFPFVFHPDEPTVVRSALADRLAVGISVRWIQRIRNIG